MLEPNCLGLNPGVATVAKLLNFANPHFPNFYKRVRNSPHLIRLLRRTNDLVHSLPSTALPIIM